MHKQNYGSDPSDAGTCPNTKCILALAALLVCLLIIYWPGFTGDWYLDDFGNIHENPNVHLEKLTAGEITKSFYGMDRTHSRFNRPLAYFSLALNYYFGGTDPLGYHVVNFAIHFGTAAFLFLLIRHILNLPVLKGGFTKQAYSIALLSTLLWATHPIQVNAVTYIVQRMAALSGMFTVMSLYCYLKGRMSKGPIHPRYARPGWYAACLFTGVCAVASKQNAAMLPISLFFFEVILLRQGSGNTKGYLFAKIFLPSLLVFLFLSVYFVGFTSLQASFVSRPFSMLERLMTESRVIFFYIRQLLYPAGSTFALLHDIQVSTSLLSPWTTLPAILLLAISVGTCFVFWRKWPLFAFSYLFFIFNHIIEGSILPLEIIFEHRNYLPSFFFFILPVIAFFKVTAFFSFSPLVRGLCVTVAALIIIAQFHTTYLQNTLYANPVIFWSINVKAYPDLHRPRHNLAKALFMTGLDKEAERQMYLSLEGKSSAKIYQKSATVYNLGVYYFYKRDYQQALKLFSLILQASPNHVKTLKLTAEIFLEMGNQDAALQSIEKAVNHDPGNSSLHIIKGFVLLARRDIDGAFREAALAESLKHNKIGVAYIMGEGYRLKGDFNKAIEVFNSIVAMDRDHFPALFSLVELYYLTGKHALQKQAVGELKRIAAKNQDALLAAYERRWNFVGMERADNLSQAMREWYLHWDRSQVIGKQ